MKERITFVHPPGGGVDPEDLEIQEEGLLGPEIESARQDRLTVLLDELPPELAQVLRDFESVHLRWASPWEHETIDPFASRISPGLHLSYTPRPNGSRDPSKLCTALQRLGLTESINPKAFTEVRAEGSSSPSFYLYHELETLHNFIQTSMQNYCAKDDALCLASIRSLYIASSFDISFDIGSDLVQLTAFWPLRHQYLAIPAHKSRRTEVGIFVEHVPPKLQSHELGVSGILAVLGEQKKPSPTLFTFPSRHRRSDSSFTSKFLAPTGLHPTMQLTLSSSQALAQDDSCAPYAYLTLPKTIFADRYQLADELFLASKNLTASRYTTLPVDLEAPAYTTAVWGSNVLLELAPPTSSSDAPWTAEIPLHLRYLKPSESGYVQAEIPYPTVFWACSSGEELQKNPFDRLSLGYDSLFEPDTVFWHVNPKAHNGTRLMNPVTVPVLKEQGASWIGFGTTLVVGLGFAWVLWKLAAAVIPKKRESAVPAKKD